MVREFPLFSSNSFSCREILMAALCRVGQGRMGSLNHRHCLRARASCQDYGTFQMPEWGLSPTWHHLFWDGRTWWDRTWGANWCKLSHIQNFSLSVFHYHLLLSPSTGSANTGHRFPGIVLCAGWFPMPLWLPPSTFWAVNLHLSSVNVPSSALSSRDSLKAVLCCLTSFLPSFLFSLLFWG